VQVAELVEHLVPGIEMNDHRLQLRGGRLCLRFRGRERGLCFSPPGGEYRRSQGGGLCFSPPGGEYRRSQGGGLCFSPPGGEYRHSRGGGLSRRGNGPPQLPGSMANRVEVHDSQLSAAVGLQVRVDGAATSPRSQCSHRDPRGVRCLSQGHPCGWLARCGAAILGNRRPPAPAPLALPERFGCPTLIVHIRSG